MGCVLGSGVRAPTWSGRLLDRLFGRPGRSRAASRWCTVSSRTADGPICPNCRSLPISICSICRSATPHPAHSDRLDAAPALPSIGVTKNAQEEVFRSASEAFFGSDIIEICPVFSGGRATQAMPPLARLRSCRRASTAGSPRHAHAPSVRTPLRLVMHRHPTPRGHGSRDSSWFPDTEASMPSTMWRSVIRAFTSRAHLPFSQSNGLRLVRRLGESSVDPG